MYNLSYWFMVFFIFSIFGYISEVIFCFIGSGKLTNRGFLHGPYCPIYGVGALLIVIFLYSYNDDPIVLFILSVVFTSILEYFTSWLMEKLFNNRWWDYSNNFANINGRVCFFNSLCFGVGALTINYLLYPMFSKVMFLIPSNWVIIISLVCGISILIDFIITTNLAFKLKKELIIIKNYIEDLKVKIPKIELFDKKIIERIKKYKKIPNHFINAFPNISRLNSLEISALREIFLKNNKKKSKR